MVKRYGLAADGNGKARRYPTATVERLLALAGRGSGIETVNHYIRAVRGFMRWMMKVKRVGSNPLDTLTLLNAKVDTRRHRRELAEVEVRTLLPATRTSKRVFRGLTAAATGFRASALANLTPPDFDLSAAVPTVTLAARFNKSKKAKVQPLPPDVAAALTVYLASRRTSAPVWRGDVGARPPRGGDVAGRPGRGRHPLRHRRPGRAGVRRLPFPPPFVPDARRTGGDRPADVRN